MKRSKKIKIFIYALIAWFIGLAIIVCDFAESYAASFNDELYDAQWRYFECSNTSNPDSWKQVSGIGVPDGFPEDYPSLSDAEYTEHCSLIRGNSSYFESTNYTLQSDSEIVVYFTPSLSQDDKNFLGLSDSVGRAELKFLSLSKLYIQGDGYWFYNSAWAANNNSKKSHTLYSPSTSLGYTYASCSVTLASTSASDSFIPLGLKTGTMKVFNNVEAALVYLTTGVLQEDALAWQGSTVKGYDGDNVYLENFQMIVHDSNAYSAYYLEFKYTIPDALKDCPSLILDIDEQFEWTVCGIADSIRSPSTDTGTDYIDLLQYPTGFKLYLDDIKAIQNFLSSPNILKHSRAVLGSETLLDNSTLSVGGFGVDSVYRVTNSKLYLTCYVAADGVYGVSYSGSVDFLSGSNYMSSYTPDSSGDYSYNGDYENAGHYYTDVSVDDSGNNVYTYYYYGTDNSKTQITATDSHDNSYSLGVDVGGGSIGTGSGSSGSMIQNNSVTLPDHIYVNVSGSDDIPDVTIEDDDLSFDSLSEAIDSGFGLIDDVDTGAKGDGYVAMLTDLYAFLPDDFTAMIMLGISSVVAIAILRVIFKR